MNSSPDRSGPKRLLCLLAAALVLAACSPRHDWREMPAANERVSALFPAKPASATRQVRLGDQAYAITLTAARVEQSQFAAGHLAVAQAADAERVARAWAASMQANLGATAVGAAQPVQVPGAAGALEVSARGTVEGKPGRMLARFAWRGSDVVASIALGQDASLTTETAEQFVQSLKMR